MGNKVYTYAMALPPLPFSATDDQKFNHGEIVTTSADLKDYPDKHEMMGVIIFTDTRMFSGISASVKFFNDDTGKLLWGGSSSMPSPGSQGWDWWNWQKIKFWIGHASWEIDKAMLVRIVVQAFGIEWVRTFRVSDSRKGIPTPVPEPECIGNETEQTVCNDPTSIDFGKVQATRRCVDGKWQTLFNVSIPFCVPDTIPKVDLPGFWDTLKDLFREPLQLFAWILNIGIINTFNAIHNLFTLTDIDEATAVSWAEWIPGLNALNKVAFGENLQGEADEDVTLGEKVELALFLIPIPHTWVFKLFGKISSRLGFRKSVQLLDDIVEQESKLLGKGATKAEVAEIKTLFDQVAGREFTKAVAKGLTKEELDWVVSTVAKQPLRAIELFVKVPSNWEKLGFATQARVLKALAGTSEPFAQETAKTLFRSMGGNAGFNAFAAVGKTGVWTGFPSAWKWWLGIIGAIMGTGFITSWTAKEFVWESSTFPLTDAMRKGDWNIAAEQLPRVEQTYEFIKGVISTIGWLNPISNIIFTRGLEEAKANLDLWKKQIELHLPPEEPPIVPPPEEPSETPPGEETPDPERTVPAGKSFITVDSNPRGAQIWIDGVSTFTVTPFAHLLDSGKHTIQLQLFKHEPTFEIVTLLPDKSIIKTYTLTPLEPVDIEKPFIPIPIEVPLEKPEIIPVKPNAWEYTITARDVETGQILNAKIIIDGIFTGKYTTNSVILEPEASFLLRLEAFGYQPGELAILTEKLP